MSRTCSVCHVSLEKKSRDSYREKGETVFCKKCYRAATRPVRESVIGNASTSNDQIQSSDIVDVPLKRGHYSHNMCIFGCKNDDLRHLSKIECHEIYIQKEIFVKYGARACSIHWYTNSLTIPTDFTSNIVGVSLSAEEINDSFKTFASMIQTQRTKNCRTSFCSMDEKLLIFETGLNHEQFRNVLIFIKDQNIRVHNKELALGVYLSRLRRGYTFDELAVRYDVTRQTASVYADLCRQVLIETLCAEYLTFSMSRSAMIQHNNEIAVRIHAPTADKIIVVFDGTYLFIQKSGNFDFQRKTYSGHKHRNLIKPMMAVFTDGYIANVWGPYKGAENDASIMNALLEDDAVWSSFKNGDVLIVDRGFRESINKIKNRGFIPKMPAFADSPREALSTQQANESRLVTKSRYIVKVINGRIKQKFQYFNKTIQNTTVHSLFDDFKVACALYNFTFKPVNLPKNHDLIIKRMLSYSLTENHLANLVKKENLNKKLSMFYNIKEYELNDFPKLEMENLELYACGTYQIKMAVQYYEDHVRETGDFVFEITKPLTDINYHKYNIDLNRKDALLLRVRVRSRHSNSIKYFVYVLINKSLSSISSIVGHACTCKVGNRVVGCCSHVMLIIWYFGFAKYLNTIRLSASSFSSIFENDWSSDSDDNEITESD